MGGPGSGRKKKMGGGLKTTPAKINLPPHLQALAKKMEKRGFGTGSFTVKDTTPKGYGPLD